eukprot:6192725-Pleurochrysis_carterae.AAC.2
MRRLSSCRKTDSSYKLEYRVSPVQVCSSNDRAHSMRRVVSATLIVSANLGLFTKASIECGLREARASDTHTRTHARTSAMGAPQKAR